MLSTTTLSFLLSTGGSWVIPNCLLVSLLLRRVLPRLTSVQMSQSSLLRRSAAIAMLAVGMPIFIVFLLEWVGSVPEFSGMPYLRDNANMASPKKQIFVF